MRAPATFLLFLFLSIRLFAQDEEKNISILLIPYQPEFYISDAERDIMAQTKQSPDEYREYFRKTLDLKIQAELEDLGPCTSMLQDTTLQGRNRLEMFYEKTGYTYSDPVGIRIKSDRKFSTKGQNKDKSMKSPLTAQRMAITNGETQFMQAEIKDTAFFSRLAATTQTNVIISINQFEIKTNYNSCLDIANKIYQRTLIVHYSLFDRKGKQLRGNFLMESFPSNLSRDNEIAERLFPGIAASIKAEVEAMAAGSARD